MSNTVMVILLANIKVHWTEIILESVLCCKSYFYFGNFIFFYFFAKTNMRHMHYQRRQVMNSNYFFIMAKVPLPSLANFDFSGTPKNSTIELILRWVLREINWLNCWLHAVTFGKEPFFLLLVLFGTLTIRSVFKMML